MATHVEGVVEDVVVGDLVAAGDHGVVVGYFADADGCVYRRVSILLSSYWM